MCLTRSTVQAVVHFVSACEQAALTSCSQAAHKRALCSQARSQGARATRPRPATRRPRPAHPHTAPRAPRARPAPRPAPRPTRQRLRAAPPVCSQSLLAESARRVCSQAVSRYLKNHRGVSKLQGQCEDSGGRGSAGLGLAVPRGRVGGLVSRQTRQKCPQNTLCCPCGSIGPTIDFRRNRDGETTGGAGTTSVRPPVDRSGLQAWKLEAAALAWRKPPRVW